MPGPRAWHFIRGCSLKCLALVSGEPPPSAGHFIPEDPLYPCFHHALAGLRTPQEEERRRQPRS
eukprot:384760-Alexandrium_andersonii.AAC.1